MTRPEYTRRIRGSARKALWNYRLTHPCVYCGESDPCCLDFHHIDPEEKLGAVADMASGRYPVEVVLREVDKCVVLCANCHRKLHAGVIEIPGLRVNWRDIFDQTPTSPLEAAIPVSQRE